MAKKKKRKIKLGRILILIITIGILVFLLFAALNKDKNTKPEKNKEIKSISTIEKYDYSLKENATSEYKKLFKKLSNTLSENEVNEEEYLELISQMFVYDFFNLDNKISKNDIGGVQFVYKDYQSDFMKYAMDSIYKHVENDVYGNRKQDLPIVDKVSVEKVKTQSYKYGDSTDEKAYIVNFDITYKDDLDYQNEGSLTVIHSDKKLEIASMSTEKSS